VISTLTKYFVTLNPLFYVGTMVSL
jgi:hypothetical protein